MLAGTSFAYFIIMPFGFSFLMQLLNGTEVSLMPQMMLYLSLALRLILAFGLIFQLPIVIFLLVRWGVVSHKTFSSYRRHMIVLAFVISAIITPPDFVTQIMMAIPFILLFEVGLLLARINKK